MRQSAFANTTGTMSRARVVAEDEDESSEESSDDLDPALPSLAQGRQKIKIQFGSSQDVCKVWSCQGSRGGAGGIIKGTRESSFCCWFCGLE